ncbi:hypothetical protein TNCV_3135851 [Trichonephila clavipes]|nr:hypothetical protein TNCV_3135851 [Trichonephila clavipes]
MIANPTNNEVCSVIRFLNARNIKQVEIHRQLVEGKNVMSYGMEVCQCEKKGDIHLVPDMDYMVDVLKLSNQAPRFSGESLETCVTWLCPDGTQHLFRWPILTVSGQSLSSNGSVVDSRELNLVFGHTEAIHNKLFISRATKYTVEPSWMLVLVWPPFELLHRALNTIVSPNIIVCDPFLIPSHHPLKKKKGGFHSIWPRLHRWKFDPSHF